MDCRVKTSAFAFLYDGGFRVSILDLMDCRVKTLHQSLDNWSCFPVSILDLMDCRVKTVVNFDCPWTVRVFQSLI